MKHLAFLFTAPFDSSHIEVWAAFFKAKRKFRIYSTACLPAALKRNSKQVRINEESGDYPELALLRYALADKGNYKLLVMTPGALPIHDFDTIYNELTATDTSLIWQYPLPPEDMQLRFQRMKNKKLFKFSLVDLKTHRLAYSLNRNHAEVLVSHDKQCKILIDQFGNSSHVLSLLWINDTASHIENRPLVYSDYGYVEKLRDNMREKISKYFEKYQELKRGGSSPDVIRDAEEELGKMWALYANTKHKPRVYETLTGKMLKNYAKKHLFLHKVAPGCNLKALLTMIK